MVLGEAKNLQKATNIGGAGVCFGLVCFVFFRFGFALKNDPWRRPPSASRRSSSATGGAWSALRIIEDKANVEAAAGGGWLEWSGVWSGGLVCCLGMIWGCLGSV